jgi:magnesium-transporting ATPase (P-type)
MTGVTMTDTAIRHRPHHELPVHELLLLLETDDGEGLTTQEAAERFHRYGPNELPHLRRHGPIVRFLLQFHHPLVYVLLGAAATTALLGEPVDASVILGVVVANAIIGFVQEAKAESALDALVGMVRTEATVVRAGERMRIPSSELVPGDVVLVEAGDKVPADLRLTHVRDLQVDESALTGESVPVAKAAVELPADTVVADRHNMAYSGTLATYGRARGVVVATGAETEIGEIHRLVGEAAGVDTPLTRKIASFSRLLTVAILGLAGVAFLIGVARGEPAADMVTAAVALAVGAIPEGLPAVVTITLAIGVSRMARRHAIIRKLPAVETLGSTTVICTDKTGTLTQNQMTVTAVVAGGVYYEVTGIGYQPDGTVTRDGAPVDLADEPALAGVVLAGLLCNDSSVRAVGDRREAVGDPTEAALVVAAAKCGLDAATVAPDHPRLDTLPFESERQYMATLHRDPTDHTTTVYVKGAVERLLAMSRHMLAPDGSVRDLDQAAVLADVERLAARGLRILAIARGEAPGPEALDDDTIEHLPLVLLGLEAMYDPPRAEAITAVQACQEAGIAVKMITGDHAITARAIAAEIGLGHGDDVAVMTGAELAAHPLDELAETAEHTTVFARVSPEQKLRLVEALQASGHVVAMTGDGVNDAPALRQADIGVAMGVGGTEVAKEASAMVLADDNFASIESAVEEGRGVFDNLTKFIVWALPTSMGEGLVILAAIVAATTLPILPVQVLWVNMATALALGLTLAFEPGEPGIMRRPPRDPAQPLLTRELVMRILLVSGIMLAGAFGLFRWEQARGVSDAEARTVAVNVFVMVELTYLLNCRSLERSMFQVGVFRNRWLVGGIVAMVGLQVAFTYAPVMNTLFHSAPIDTAAWLRIAAVALAGYVAVEVEKWIRRHVRERHLAALDVPHGTAHVTQGGATP